MAGKNGCGFSAGGGALRAQGIVVVAMEQVCGNSPLHGRLGPSADAGSVGEGGEIGSGIAAAEIVKNGGKLLAGDRVIRSEAVGTVAAHNVVLFSPGDGVGIPVAKNTLLIYSLYFSYFILIENLTKIFTN